MHDKTLFTVSDNGANTSQWLLETVLQPTHSKKNPVTITEHKAALCVTYRQQQQQTDSA